MSGRRVEERLAELERQHDPRVEARAEHIVDVLKRLAAARAEFRAKCGREYELTDDEANLVYEQATRPTT